MKILVTGASGYIGCHVLEQLLADPAHEILCSSRDEQRAASCPWYDRVRYLPFDLDKPPAVPPYAYFQKPDLLIHLAWNDLTDYHDPVHFETILPQHYRFLKEMIESGLPRLSVAGTCAEYGPQNGCLCEAIAPQPATAYGLAKDTLRKYLEYLLRQQPFVFHWLRIFYISGRPPKANTLLAKLDQAVMADQRAFPLLSGEQLKDYLNIRDMARLIVRLSLQATSTGIINCCSGRPISIRKLVEDHLRVQKNSIRLPPQDAPLPADLPFAAWGDTTKLMAALNHCP